MNGRKTYEPAPSSVDQTAQSAVAPVKMQEQCGSSLSFSTTGGLENACSSLLADTTDSVCNGALFPFALKCAIFTGSNFEHNASGGRMTEDLTVLSSRCRSLPVHSRCRGSRTDIEGTAGMFGQRDDRGVS